MDLILTPVGLTSCDREPIHTPDSIQPHGLMLVVERDGLRVRHAAGDIELRLGQTGWQGMALSGLVGDMVASRVAGLDRNASGFMGQLIAPSGEKLDVTACNSAGDIIVELETASAEPPAASLVIDRLATAAAAFERAASPLALCERAAIEFRRLTGFDRVMIYRFLDDGAGKVLAEDRRGSLHSFLNHHFPASDIPLQARALYLRNVLRVIPDASYQPISLRPAWNAAAPLDMSDCSLRSVSPVHLEYLRNMGVQASASFSIVTEGALWGLVACHNETSRTLDFDVRVACRSLAGSLGHWIRAKDEAEGYRERLRLRGFEDDIAALLSREGTLDEAVSNHLGEIGRMMGSDGVAVLRGRELIRHGVCPSDGEIRLLGQWLLDRGAEPVFSTGNLAPQYSPAEGFRASGSGLLAVTLSAEEPWILLWFRAEQVEIVKWAGAPQKALGTDEGALTPRASFAAWLETVHGHARTWSTPEVSAAMRLRVALLEVQQGRRVRDLNRQLTVILQDKDLLLQQKEFLITEVNHRVQNSLQLVSSFLSMQARASGNPGVEAALGEARRRLTAVALVHRRLYRGDQVDVVDADRYIEELCTDTFSFMGTEWKRQMSLALSPMQISTDRAIPLGLVLTELLINANKHAYDGAPGPVEVALVADRTHFRMIVSDKGVGRASPRSGFGSRIMGGLVNQLGGEMIESDNQPGLRVTVAVPLQATRSVTPA